MGLQTKLWRRVVEGISKVCRIPDRERKPARVTFLEETNGWETVPKRGKERGQASRVNSSTERANGRVDSRWQRGEEDVQGARRGRSQRGQNGEQQTDD